MPAPARRHHVRPRPLALPVAAAVAMVAAHTTDDPRPPSGRWAPGLAVPPALDPRTHSALPPGCEGPNGGDCAATPGSGALWPRDAGRVSVVAACTYCFGVGAAADGSGDVFLPAYNEYTVWRTRLGQSGGDGVVGAQALPLLSEWHGFGGIYSVAWGQLPDSTGNAALYVANDGTCAGPDDCSEDGVVRQIVLAGGGVLSERIVLRNLTSPRQLVVDAKGGVYVVQEGGPGPAVLRWDPSSETAVTVVARSEAATPQGVAVAPNGDVFFSEYGVMEPDVADPDGHGSLAGVAAAPGGVKVKRAVNGAVETVATGLWRCRGIALDTVNGALFISNEANAWDQGSSGSIHRWDWRTGALDLVLAGLDYPQFPQWVPGPGNDGGALVVSLARHNLVLSISPSGSPGALDQPAATPAASRAPPPTPTAAAAAGASALPPGTNWTSAGGVWWPGGGGSGGATENLTVTVCGLTLTGPAEVHSGGALSVWLTLPSSALPGLDRGRLKDGFSGFSREFELPVVECNLPSARRCDATAEVVHGHRGARWPMLVGYAGGDRRFNGRIFPAGASEGAAAFDESPVGYAVWVRALRRSPPT